MRDIENELAHAKRLREEGRQALALEHAIRAIDDPANDPADASLLAAELSLELGRAYEAQSWVEKARSVGALPCLTDRLEIMCQLELNHVQLAAELLDAAESDCGCAVCEDRGWVTLQRVRIALLREQWQQAFDGARSIARGEPTREAAWRALAAAAVNAPNVAGADELLEVLDTEQLATLATGPALGVQRLLEAFWTVSPGDRRLVALLQFVDASMELGDALKWSGRLRIVGFGDDCPTLGIAADQERPASMRVRAAAAAFNAFGDVRAEPLLALAAAHLAPPEIPDAFREVQSLAPDLIEVFVTAAASDTRRCLVLAELLAEPATVGFGLALLSHAVVLNDGRITSASSAHRMDSTRRGLLWEAAASAGREDLLAVLG